MATTASQSSTKSGTSPRTGETGDVEQQVLGVEEAVV
jgi:hypothetical protein